MSEREVRCDGCDRRGYWLSNREDDLPEGHENDLILCGGDGDLPEDRPYCDDCIATERARIEETREAHPQA